MRPSAAEGRFEVPPYPMDTHMLRALLPSTQWDWPAPTSPAVPHAMGWTELAVTLARR